MTHIKHNKLLNNRLLKNNIKKPPKQVVQKHIILKGYQIHFLKHKKLTIKTHLLIILLTLDHYE